MFAAEEIALQDACVGVEEFAQESKCRAGTQLQMEEEEEEEEQHESELASVVAEEDQLLQERDAERDA